MTATDADSGVAGTEYKIGSGAWTAYTAAFTFQRGTAPTEVSFRSTDVAGNVEVVRGVTVPGAAVAERVASATTVTVLTPT
ncbi:copper-binding protein, partial [Nakamurella silvestris]